MLWICGAAGGILMQALQMLLWRRILKSESGSAKALAGFLKIVLWVGAVILLMHLDIRAALVFVFSAAVTGTIVGVMGLKRGGGKHA